MVPIAMEIRLEHCQYEITIENGLLNRIGSLLEAYPGMKLGLVTDETVWSLYGQRMLQQLQGRDAAVTILPPGESSKHFGNMQRVYSDWIAKGLTRRDMALAFGGGVIGDLTGFAAATYLRGIPFIQIPTTLLSQLDSSIGGKVAVDLPEGKNLVGAFHHPEAVWMDPELLKTLTDRIFRDGLGEAVKAACIADSRLFRLLEQLPDRESIQREIHSILPAALAVKKTVVEADEKENSSRKLLNFGHTLGHGLESYHHYERWTHGEAVAIGMAHITRASEAIGLTEAGTAKRLESLLEKLHLPAASDVSVQHLIPWMQRDKKAASGSMDLILIRNIGEGFIHRVAMNELENFFIKGA